MTELAAGAMSEAAVQLAKAGWPVFPVDASSKKPRSMHGHLDATRDLKKIRVWAHQFDYGGAIATPTGNGLLVIDIDPRNGGRMPFWAPPTRTARTQSGGIHLHYKVVQDIKSRAGLFGPGVDSKSSGGYVLLPPSPGYTWETSADGSIPPRTVIANEILEAHMVSVSSGLGGIARLAPNKWHRGIIHDQAVAWAAYFAGVYQDDADVERATWNIIRQAQEAGTYIDNKGGHIDAAIRWVLEQEHSRPAAPTPSLG